MLYRHASFLPFSPTFITRRLTNYNLIPSGDYALLHAVTFRNSATLPTQRI
jgi:hypothetical protein